MNPKEIRKKQKMLEGEILDLLNEFEERTDVSVTEIEYDLIPLLGLGTTKIPYHKFIKTTIKI